MVNSKWGLVVVLILLTACSKGKAMEIFEPYYYLKLAMANCPRTIAVNGFVVEEDLPGASNFSEYPINPHIRNGENELVLVVAPEEYMKTILDDHPRCEVEVRVKGEVGGKEVDYLVTNLIFTPNYTDSTDTLHATSQPAGSYAFTPEGQTQHKSDATDAVVGEVSMLPPYDSYGGVPMGRSFTAKVPFPEWAFFSADTIFEYPMTDDKFYAMEAEIWPKVLELWDLFENKELDKILPQFEMRSKEYDQAYYREPGETFRLLEASIKRNYSEKAPLDRIDMEQMQLVVTYDGRMATMLNAGNMIGTVLFYYKEGDMNISYDVYWMKKDGKWVIGR